MWGQWGTGHMSTANCNKKKTGDTTQYFCLSGIRLSEGSNVRRTKLEFAFHLYERLPFRDEVSSRSQEQSHRGLSVCKLSENFNENSEIIFLILLLGVFQDYGKQFQTLPTETKIKGQQIGNLSWQTNNKQISTLSALQEQEQCQ